MKKTTLLCAVLLMMVACNSPLIEDDVTGNEELASAVTSKTKKFTFTVKGDFGDAGFTRGYLTADGKEMTDLWLFDYVDDRLVQQLHQTADDEEWGQPHLALTYGQHHIYFVASRGDTPTIDEENPIISWNSVRDTFWKDYEVSVVSTSNGNRAVTLDRVVTKLRIAVADEVPVGCAMVSVTPERWYFGLNYMTGQAAAAKRQEINVAVPESYIGTTGTLAVNVFGLSGADEWTTNVTVTAKNSEGDEIGSVVINGVPFKRNRASSYSGNLFGSVGTMGVSVNADWEDEVSGTW